MIPSRLVTKSLQSAELWAEVTVEDSLIIETGADRNKMKITRWAIQSNNTANDRAEAEKAAAKAAQEAEKEERAAARGKARKTRKTKNEDEE